MGRTYNYIGADDLRGSTSKRHRIQKPQDVKDWTGQHARVRFPFTGTSETIRRRHNGFAADVAERTGLTADGKA